MTQQTIDHSTLSRMTAAGAIRDARVIGQTGGWTVAFNTTNGNDYLLAVARKSQPRRFKKIDTLIAYLHDLGISQFNVDTTAHTPESYARPDRSESLKQTHDAAAYDKWFREELEERIRIADSPDAVWVPHEQVKAERAKWRADMMAKVAGDAA